MRNKKGKIVTIFLTIISLISININLYAHPGGTDSSGGHRDNKNKSGLGNYHYHCGGHSAHLHTNGVCPYESKSTSSASTSKKTTSKSSTTKSTTTTKKSTSNKNTSSSITSKSTTNKSSISSSKSKTSSSSTNKTTSNKSTTNSNNTVEKETKEVNININTNSSNNINNSLSINDITTNIINNVVDIEENKTVEISAPIIEDNRSVNVIENNQVPNSEEETDGGALVTLGIIGGGVYLIHKRKKNKKNK